MMLSLVTACPHGGVDAGIQSIKQTWRYVNLERKRGAARL